MQRNDGTGRVGMVYAMTNAAQGNAIAAFMRAADGTLSYGNSYGTRGQGTGMRGVSAGSTDDGIDPLSSQGSLMLSKEGNFLFCVNAGSDSISIFRVLRTGELLLSDVTPSGGFGPNCLNAFGNLLYVCNVGNRANNFSSNLTGFRFDSNGRLSMIPNSTRSLSTPNAQPACLTFSPDGRYLIVSELSTNRLSIYPVNRNGTLSNALTYTSRGQGPFGSCILFSGLLLVTEAGANAVSSYVLSPDGTLGTVSASVHNGQMATCWISPLTNGHFAYTSNAGSGSISTYQVNRNGTVTLMGNTPSMPQNMGAPLDNCVSGDGHLYVLNGNRGSISVFTIDSSGRPTRLQIFNDTHLPRLGSQGLAVL